jgi:hypothetical protein
MSSSRLTSHDVSLNDQRTSAFMKMFCGIGTIILLDFSLSDISKSMENFIREAHVVLRLLKQLLAAD